MLKFKKNVEILKNVKILATPYELWKIKSEDEIEFVISLSYSRVKMAIFPVFLDEILAFFRMWQPLPPPREKWRFLATFDKLH